MTTQEQWIRILDRILDGIIGVQFCDLPDEDQAELLSLQEQGMSPEEAVDVFVEVSDVA